MNFIFEKIKFISSQSRNSCIIYMESFSRDVTAAMLVSLNKGPAAMLVSPSYPPGIELYSYGNVFFSFV